MNNNRLTMTAPVTLNVAGKEIPIDYSFKAVLNTFAAFKDDEMPEVVKMDIFLDNIYLEPIDDPDYIQDAIDKANWFIRGGDTKKNANKSNKQALVCFEQDSQYIYDAFLKKNIDLDANPNMHWWIFKSHFAELEECFLTRLMYLRNKMRQPKGLDKEEKKEVKEIGDDIVNIKIGGIDMYGNIDIWN